MPFLIALLSVIVVITILLSMKLSLTIDYSDETVVTLKYLFLKFVLLDTSKPEEEKTEKKTKKEKKPKKENKPKKEDKQATEDKKKTEGKDEKKGDTKENGLLKQLYIDQGYDGIIKMFKALGKSLGSFFGRLYKNLVIDELYINMTTVGSDAADTAIKHGRLCAFLFPILGKLVSTCKVKKYDFDISPDFLATKSEASAYARIHFTPLIVIGAVLMLAIRLIFKVLIKIIFSQQKSEQTPSVKSTAKEIIANSNAEVKNTNNKRNINKDGASK